MPRDVAFSEQFCARFSAQCNFETSIRLESDKPEMQWEDLLGHDQQKRWFETALAQKRLATSFLFVGPEGIGKRQFAILLAKSLLCRSSAPDDLQFCGQCEDCVQVDAATHPDLLQVSKPADRAFLPIELLIGEREKRMREGLCHDISMRPYGGRRKIAILDAADSLNVEGANCLLKTLEEPPLGSMLILIGTSLQRQLPTIRSRCQAILFRPLAAEDLAKLIEAGGLETESAENDQEPVAFDSAKAMSLAEQSQGSLAMARLIADPELLEFRTRLFRTLASREIPIGEFIKSCTAIVDAAGKDNRAKRERMKVLLGMAAEFYRGAALEQAAGAETAENAIDSVAATKCWNRCLDAIAQVERNANQAGLIEAWTTDIAQLSGK